MNIRSTIQHEADPPATDPAGTTPGYPGPGDAPTPPPGYEVREKIAEGGMGVVYLARHARLNRTVALKMMKDRNPASVRRFLAEAAIVAAVTHPHVVDVYEFGETPAGPYFTMEYLPRGSLAQYLRATVALAPKAAAGLVAAVARGVQAAHEAGIVHRDLKPANVLFDAQLEPKVTDFGIAKRVDSELTGTHEIVGTPAYMAPEQAAGGSKFVGPQADVWALGVILYECLTGERPFEAGSNIALMLSIQTDDPAPPRKRMKSIPRDLELVCLKCLSKDPADRYATAGELAADLTRFRNGETVWVSRAGPVVRAAKWARRKPTLAAAWGLGLAAALLLAFGAAAAALWQRAEVARAKAADAQESAETALAGESVARQGADAAREKETAAAAAARKAADEANAERAAAEGARREAFTQQVRAVRAAAIARTAETEANAARAALAAQNRELAAAGDELKGTNGRLETATAQLNQANADLTSARYAREVNLAYREYLANNLPRAQTLLDLAPPLYRGWEWRYVHRVLNQARELPAAGGACYSVAYAPDGKTVYGAYRFGAVNGFPTDPTDPPRPRTTLTVPGGQMVDVAVSPDGRWLVAGGSEGVEDRTTPGIVKTVLRGAVKVYAVPADGVRSPEVQPGGGMPTEAGDVYAVAVSPDGEYVLAGGQDGKLRSRRLASFDGWGTLPLTASVGVIQSIKFSADGKFVAVGGTAKRVEVHTYSAGRLTGSWDINPGSGPITAVSWGGDNRLAVAGENGIVRVYPARSLTATLSFPTHADGVTAVAFSPDGSTIFTGSPDSSVRAWDVATGGRPLFSLKGPTQAVWGLAVSPDGQTLAASSLEGSLWLWPLTATAEPKPVKLDDTLNAFDLSPDEKTLAVAGAGGVSLYDLATGEITRLKPPTGRPPEVMPAPVPAMPLPKKNSRRRTNDDRFAVLFQNPGEHLPRDVPQLQPAPRQSAPIPLPQPPEGLPAPPGPDSPPTPAPTSPNPGGTSTQSAVLGGGAFALPLDPTARERKGPTQVQFTGPRTLIADGLAPADRPWFAAQWELGAVQGEWTAGPRPGLRGGVAVEPYFDRETGGVRMQAVARDAEGNFKQRYIGHRGDTLCVHVSPDLTRVVTGGVDRTVKIWAIDTGKDVLTIPNFPDWVTGVRFTRDDRLIVGCLDGTIRVFVAPAVPNGGVMPPPLSLANPWKDAAPGMPVPAPQMPQAPRRGET